MKHPFYLKNLNGVRAFAALAVVIHHIEQFKYIHGYSNLWETPFIRNLGGNAVSVFFVLSGFLITYLLLIEKQKTNQVNLPKFYLRRILRIWPLYFIIIGIGAVLNFQEGNGDTFLDSLFYFLFFIPNFILADGIAIPFISHLWSIGVEEQFYVFWPLIIKYIKKRLVGFLILFILFFLVVRNVEYYFHGTSYLIKVLNFTRFDLMAIGGIGAVILNSNNKIYQKIKSILSNRLFQIAVFLFFIVLVSSVTSVYKFYFLENIFFGFTVMILLLILVGENSLFNLEYGILREMGDISYGIYMYHAVMIHLIISLTENILEKNNVILSNILIYAGSILGTILLAFISYTFVEKWFLNLKAKFTFGKA